METFNPKTFLSSSVMARITQLRVENPDEILEITGKRPARRPMPADGKLCILAADHPARGITVAGGDAFGMADRQDYLSRIVRVIAGGAVDGVMATMDILEDLLFLHHLMLESGAPGLLDGKWLVPSLNGAGISGSAWELNDQLIGPSPETCIRLGMDGGKARLRICSSERDSLATIQSVAGAISEMNRFRMPFFLAPMPVERGETGWEPVNEAESLARILGIATGLGDSSRYIWLTLPYCADFGRVVSATSLPILLEQGSGSDGMGAILSTVAHGLSAGSNVRGTMLGSEVLYSEHGDPLVAARAVAGLVHKDWSLEQAEGSLAAPVGQLDAIRRWLD